ncbi:MAG: DUF721 domain-containing protein [Nitrospirota bacterium]|nr:DUF721 domain-containing protein [Nitrospirota bacterium]MDH5769523.1 DUF721 domain-containing protein [Nitrospirota bacterium]
MQRADSLILPLVRELGFEDGVRLAEMKKKWDDLFHEPLSSHMSPLMLSGGEVILNVDSPVWLQELNFLKEDLIKKLSHYGVRSVRFRLGRVSTGITSGVKRQSTTRSGSKDKSLTAKELSYIEETVSQINDNALRETARKAIQKAFNSGRVKK